MSIPRRDPNFSMADLQSAADRFLDAGKEYWEACHKAGLNLGAVIWIEHGDKGMAVFTRGEYRDTIMRNIPELGPVHQLGGTMNESQS